LLAFGTVTADNHNGLKALAGQVRQGERVELELLRGGPTAGETIRVGLVPREGWGGRGLIGCVLGATASSTLPELSANRVCGGDSRLTRVILRAPRFAAGCTSFPSSHEALRNCLSRLSCPQSRAVAALSRGTSPLRDYRQLQRSPFSRSLDLLAPFMRPCQPRALTADCGRQSPPLSTSSLPSAPPPPTIIRQTCSSACHTPRDAPPPLLARHQGPHRGLRSSLAPPLAHLGDAFTG
jgi:hypothetical protein